MSSDIADPTPRINSTLGHVGHALREYRAHPEAADDLCDVVAALLQEMFGPKELEFLFSATKRALSYDVLEAHGFYEIFRDPYALKNVARDTKRRVDDGLRWDGIQRRVNYYLRHGWWPEQLQGATHEHIKRKPAIQKRRNGATTSRKHPAAVDQ